MIWAAIQNLVVELRWKIIGLEELWNLWTGLNKKKPLEKLNPLPNS